MPSPSLISQVIILNPNNPHNIILIPNFIFSVTFSPDFQSLLLSSKRTTKDYVDGYWTYIGTPTLEWWGSIKQSSLPLSEDEHVTLWKEAISLNPQLKELLANLT